MTSAGSGCPGTGRRGALRRRVDYQAARRQIEAVTEAPASVRSRALGTYVGLFELADDDGVVEVTSQVIADRLSITRVSFNQYRQVLAAAGLLEVRILRVGARVGARRRLRLLAPSAS